MFGAATGWFLIQSLSPVKNVKLFWNYSKLSNRRSMECRWENTEYMGHSNSSSSEWG